jgi:hypothetical protein
VGKLKAEQVEQRRKGLAVYLSELLGEKVALGDHGLRALLYAFLSPDDGGDFKRLARTGVLNTMSNITFGGSKSRKQDLDGIVRDRDLRSFTDCFLVTAWCSFRVAVDSVFVSMDCDGVFALNCSGFVVARAFVGLSISLLLEYAYKPITHLYEIFTLTALSFYDATCASTIPQAMELEEEQHALIDARCSGFSKDFVCAMGCTSISHLLPASS